MRHSLKTGLHCSDAPGGGLQIGGAEEAEADVASEEQATARPAVQAARCGNRGSEELLCRGSLVMVQGMEVMELMEVMVVLVRTPWKITAEAKGGR